MDFIEITEEPLKVDEISAQVTDKSTGATSLFIGTTRDNFDGKKVIKLEYEAYTPMAKKKLKELCNRLRVKWEDLYHIAIYHRLGEVGPCEASVIIAISSAHRKSSLEAVHFAIDELKSTVPIWKKELYEDGSVWKQNSECFWLKKQNQPMEVDGRVDSNLVQVHACKQELDDRIDKFIEAKREDINATNILEFCNKKSRINNDFEDEGSCARTDAVLVKKQDSKSHLRKSVVSNFGFGPSMTRVLDERLSNMEQSVGENVPISKDVYSRLKALEDRLLLLERISPQVASSFETNQETRNPVKSEFSNEQTVKKYEIERKENLTSSLADINNEISQLRNQLLS